MQPAALAASLTLACAPPTPGCWEITGGVGEARLSFIVFVEKIGAGPDWRFEGVQRGWRVTSSPEKSP